MTNTTPIQAITANFIRKWKGRKELSGVYLEGAYTNGETFDHLLSLEQAKELLADLEDAVLDTEHHHDRGAAFSLDRGAA